MHFRKNTIRRCNLIQIDSQLFVVPDFVICFYFDSDILKMGFRSLLDFKSISSILVFINKFL